MSTYDFYEHEDGIWEQECQELIARIKQTALNEAKDEMESTKAELEHLREIKKREREWETEMQQLKRELAIAKAEAESKARKARITELFGDNLVNAWGVRAQDVPVICKACGGTKKQVFYDSLNRRYEVNCKCKEKQRFEFIPQRLTLLSLVDNNGRISRYYRRIETDFLGKEKEDKKYVDDWEKIWVYDKTADEVTDEELKDKLYWNLVFETEARCQSFCDYRNRKNRERWEKEDKE